MSKAPVLYRSGVFYDIGNKVSYIIKNLRGDVHSQEEKVYRKRPRPARQCALAHSLFYHKKEEHNV